MLVRGAVSLAQRFNVSPMLIGVTLVGFGTSTPALVTSLQAAFNGLAGIAVGNVVGSNIYNILGIVEITALVRPIAVLSQIAVLDIWVMLLATAALVGLIVVRQPIGRLAGGALLACYVAFALVLLA